VQESEAHPRTPPAPEGPLGPEAEPPGWLRLVAIVTAAGMLAFGVIGLALAIPGWYRPVVVFPLSSIATLLLVLCARPAWQSRPLEPMATRRVSVPAAIGIALILAVTVWNISHTSEHVLSDRDPGIYATEGRWIARSGRLDVQPAVGPFANDPSLVFNSFGTAKLANGHLTVLFAHMLPVLLAEAHAVGGSRLLFWLPDILGGIALLGFFVLAWRLLRRPWFALGATAALAFVLPQVNFTRDTYSEIPSQVLIFTALWLMTTDRPAPHWRVTLVAGLFLGSMQGVRIDAIGFAVGVPVLFAVGWLRAEREAPAERLRFARSGAAFLAGGLAGFLLGYIDLTRRSQSYYSVLSADVHALGKAFVASAVVAIVAVLLWPRGDRTRSRRPVAALANVAAAGVLIAGIGAWALRPRFLRVHGGELPIGDLQTAEHQVVDLTRRYYELSLTWMSWYLGPILVAAAIVGAALLVRALLRGGHLHALAAVFVLGPMSVLYLWNAEAFPDQVWVDRRFLCGAIPALILLGFGLAAWFWGTGPTPSQARAARTVAVAIVVLGVGYPIYATWNVRDMSSQRGFPAVVNDTCHLLGPHAAVVAVGGGEADLTAEWDAQALRAWCGADVAVMIAGASLGDLQQLAGRARGSGRSLYVVGTPATVRAIGARWRLEPTRTAVNTDLLQQTLTHRPQKYVAERFSLVVAKVAPA
jgi:hypothetical protein